MLTATTVLIGFSLSCEPGIYSTGIGAHRLKSTIGSGLCNDCERMLGTRNGRDQGRFRDFQDDVRVRSNGWRGH